MLNLDTHILLHAMAGSVKSREQKLLLSDRWGISAIVLWELGKLQQLGRIELDLHDPDVERFLANIYVWPLTLEIVRAIPTLDFHADPADEIIAATSVVHHAPLLTRDRRLLRSSVVPLAKTVR